MRQAYRILFLILTVVFSFGFTIGEPDCCDSTKAEHNCCSKPEKSPTSKDCDGDCCLHSTVISSFEESTASSTTSKIRSANEKKANHAPNQLVALKAVNKCISGNNCKPWYLFLKTPKFSLIKTQVWLI